MLIKRCKLLKALLAFVWRNPLTILSVLFINSLITIGAFLEVTYFSLFLIFYCELFEGKIYIIFFLVLGLFLLTKLNPIKSNPFVSLVIRVFSSFSSNPILFDIALNTSNASLAPLRHTNITSSAYLHSVAPNF